MSFDQTHKYTSLGIPWPTGQALIADTSEPQNLQRDLEIMAKTTDAAIVDVKNETERVDTESQSRDAAQNYTAGTLETYVDRITSDNPLIEVAGYTHVFADAGGYVAGGVTDSGEFNFEQPPTVMGAGATTLLPVDDENIAFAFTDKDGYSPFIIYRDGTVWAAGLGSDTALANANEAVGFTKSIADEVACIGDSLTNGYFGGSSGHTADAYPAKLQALMPAGVTVYNVSTSGWCVDEVAVRIGAIPVPLTVAGGSIPASGAVEVTTTAVIGFRSLGNVVSIPGSLAGIPGTLRRENSNTVFTFTRTTTGAATAVPAGTLFAPDQAGHSARTSVILLGRNDVSWGATGAEATVAEHIAAGVKRIVDWHSRQLKQVLVLSPTTSVNEERGSAGHTTVTTAGQLLQNMFGAKYFDLRRYLIEEAIYDLGITPTSTDLAKMSADTLPPSIMDPGSAGTGDAVHWSKATASLVAQKINEYFTAREWIRP